MNKDYLNVRGRIFDIQKFSIHDGPGIRTIVFLKGCFLRCKWCCNPESQNYEIENMTVAGKNKIIGRDVTVSEVMADILKDMPYYRRSGGGITLSGGEVLFQPDFAAALLQAGKESGISTAIESTGAVKFEIIEKLLPYLDVFLMDIKHANSKKHEEFTGISNELILENAYKIADKAKKLIIRVPVVSTVNDTAEEIGAIAKFVTGLPNANEIHLLPYHRYGRDKYAGLKRDYLLDEIIAPTDEKMEELLNVVKSYGLKCQIGG